MQQKDSNLYRRAFKERWPIPKTKRQVVVKQLVNAVENAEDPRAVIAAARALIEADKLNLEQEKRDAGGETLNVNVHGELHVLTDEQLNQRIQEAEARLAAAFGGKAAAPSTNGRCTLG